MMLLTTIIDVPKGVAEGGIMVVSFIIAIGAINAIKNFTAILVALGLGCSALSSITFMFRDAVFPLVQEFDTFNGVDKDLHSTKEDMTPFPSLMDGATTLSKGGTLHLPFIRVQGTPDLPTKHDSPLAKWLLYGVFVFLGVVCSSLSTTLVWWLYRRVALGIPSPYKYRVMVDGDLEQRLRQFEYSYPTLKADGMIYDLRRAKKMDRDIIRLNSGALLAFQPAEAAPATRKSLLRAA
jgi:hypothetical protein